jgi:hypothetical protein
MNIMPSTLQAILRDLVQSLQASGIDKLLIFNSHGGNELKPMLRELYGLTSVQIFFCNWFQMIRDVAAEVCQCPEDHAGEMETSMILNFRPELVAHHPDGQLAGDSGQVRPFAFEALEKGWVGITRPWHLLTTNSGSGNPHAATAGKAQQLTQAIVDRVAPFLTQLAAADTKPPFPFANELPPATRPMKWAQHQAPAGDGAKVPVYACAPGAKWAVAVRGWPRRNSPLDIGRLPEGCMRLTSSRPSPLWTISSLSHGSDHSSPARPSSAAVADQTAPMGRAAMLAGAGSLRAARMWTASRLLSVKIKSPYAPGQG